MAESCPECEGTTFKRVVRDGIDIVVRCDCRSGGPRESAMIRCGVPGRYRECAFDGRSGGRPFDCLKTSLEQAKRVAENWAEAFPDVEAGLLLSGPPGVGKTHLGVAILRRILVERGISAQALFADYRSLLREIKSSYHPETPVTEKQVLRPILEAEPLVLDDLGGESSTLWVFDTLSYILNQRYNERRLTIITTNFADKPSAAGPTVIGARAHETLADRVTLRLRSRLYEMCRDVRITGDDYRQSTLQANFTG